ncbi:proline-rich protein 2-like [Mustela erminea]|uniref:proline-rich protein 2-like n=1 Tax=Mustela erminea TaxID=36723 RepID=UPI0013867110|nr:proline-rich protein 2-like [Mustela erminea]
MSRGHADALRAGAARSLPGRRRRSAPLRSPPRAAPDPGFRCSPPAAGPPRRRLQAPSLAGGIPNAGGPRPAPGEEAARDRGERRGPGGWQDAGAPRALPLQPPQPPPPGSHTRPGVSRGEMRNVGKVGRNGKVQGPPQCTQPSWDRATGRRLVQPTWCPQGRPSLSTPWKAFEKKAASGVSLLVECSQRVSSAAGCRIPTETRKLQKSVQTERTFGIQLPVDMSLGMDLTCWVAFGKPGGPL